jgi:dCMP deaminase
MLINAGIRKIYYLDGYDDPLSDQLFEEAGIEVERLDL